MADPQSLNQITRGDLLGPGILGLFGQGLLTGLVIAQFSTFLERTERDCRSLVALAVFLTIIALCVSLPPI